MFLELGSTFHKVGAGFIAKTFLSHYCQKEVERRSLVVSIKKINRRCRVDAITVTLYSIKSTVHTLSAHDFMRTKAVAALAQS